MTAYGCGKEEPKKAAEAPKAAARRAGREASPSRSATPARSPAASPTSARTTRTASRLAVDEANAKKIKIDGKHVKFEMMTEDDQADPKVGTTVAQKLVDAKVAGVVGHLNSGVTIPASADLQQGRHPGDLRLGDQPEADRAGLQDRVPHRRPRRPAGPGDRRSYLAERDQAQEGRDHRRRDRLRRGPRQRGREDAQGRRASRSSPREKGTDKTTDWKAILTKIKGKNPDAVFYGGMDATGGPLLKQARELGIKAVFAFGDGACTDEMSKLAGAAAEGLLCSQAGLPPQAASKEFLDAFKAKYGEVKQYAPFTYDGAEPADRGDEEGELGRSGQVPARAGQDQLRGRHRQDRVRRQGRPQGRRDDDLPP